MAKRIQFDLPGRVLWRWFILLFGSLVLATSAVAADRPKGLMWNRSGLPATIPLQVKTDAGHDYFLQLRDTTTDKAVLAAYIHGGEFFRVLVPPGRFDLVFSLGKEWQGEDALFGPETRLIALDTPLNFRVTGSRKQGYLIDLTEAEMLEISEVAICQRFALDLDSLRRTHPLFGDKVDLSRTYPAHTYMVPHPKYDLRSQFCGAG